LPPEEARRFAAEWRACGKTGDGDFPVDLAPYRNFKLRIVPHALARFRAGRHIFKAAIAAARRIKISHQKDFKKLLIVIII